MVVHKMALPQVSHAATRDDQINWLHGLAHSLLVRKRDGEAAVVLHMTHQLVQLGARESRSELQKKSVQSILTEFCSWNQELISELCALWLLSAADEMDVANSIMEEIGFNDDGSEMQAINPVRFKMVSEAPDLFWPTLAKIACRVLDDVDWWITVLKGAIVNGEFPS
jgi:hypothetical protein